MIHPEDREFVIGRFRKMLEGEPVPEHCEFRFVRKDGSVLWVEIHVNLTEYNGRPTVQAAYIDISDRKRAEQALLEKDRDLERKTQELQELNAAFKVLLEYQDEERERLEEYILRNVEELIFPYIEKLQKRRLDDGNRAILHIIKQNIEDLISPFAKTLSSKHLELTPTETQIADLVRQGRTSKEIASLMDVSLKAIEFHRINIRKKLGLLHKKTNLRSYLDSFTSQKPHNTHPL